MNDKGIIEVGILSYTEAQISAIQGMTDLFQLVERVILATEDVISSKLRVSHWALEDDSRGVMRIYDSMPGVKSEPSVLIVPPTLSEPQTIGDNGGYKAWLKALYERGTLLSSVCGGAFVLAETGILDGRKATTHWMYSDYFERCFPKVQLESDRLIIDDGNIITAGGAMAWTDLCLKLLDRFFGTNVMLKAANILLVDPPKREQCFYSSFSPKMMHGDAAILKVQRWLQNTDEKDVSVGKLSALAGLNERTFQRRFIKATGISPSEYCQRLRVGKGRELLQFSRLSVETIAWEVGYQDVGAFRKIFQRYIGLSPSDYRTRFSAN